MRFGGPLKRTMQRRLECDMLFSYLSVKLPNTPAEMIEVARVIKALAAHQGLCLLQT